MALGIVNVTENGITPIERGGTGKTTAGAALQALGGFSKSGGTIKGTVAINGKVTMEGALQQGYQNTASGSCSHAEGTGTTAGGSFSHAEGWETTTSGSSAHAEGDTTTASGSSAHAEGNETIASGWGSHAEGHGTESSGWYSHAQGAFTEARARNSFTAGNETLAAAENQFVIGNANVESTDKNDIFIIGNGITRNSAGAMSNCLRVTKSSGVYSNSTYHSTGADYAEYFQWKDRNSNNEDRVGLFVTLDGEEIRIANSNDDNYILGIVSVCPSVCGEAHEDQWKDMYLTDIYGRPILEEVTVPDEFIMLPDLENPGKRIKTLIQEAHTEIRQKVNENYDGTQQYIPRSKRPEWSAVGLLGKLVVIDDGVCKVNDWCTAGEGGIAVKSEQKTRFKVMARLDQNHIKVMML